MRLIECTQGTEEWHAARAGVITASCFAQAVSKLSKSGKFGAAGSPTAEAHKYAAEIAMERITGRPYGSTYTTPAMRRGIELEPDARVAYEVLTGEVVQESGFAVSDCGAFGYSTDGLVEGDGLIEIKCLVDLMHIISIFEDKDLDSYLHQMQGGLWITGREWCDFVLYVPDLAPVGNELFVQRVYRDEAFISQLEADLKEFDFMVQLKRAALSKKRI